MKPLLSNEDIEKLCSRWLPRLAQDWDVAWKMREIYEEDRKKKDELIQKLVDALDWYVQEDDTMEGEQWDELNAPWIEGRKEAEELLKAAAEAGYRPTEQ